MGNSGASVGEENLEFCFGLVRVDLLIRTTPWRRDRLPTPVFLGFPGGSNGKKSACNSGDLGSIPGLARSPREENGYPLQYSGVENFMDRRAWQDTVHGVTKSQI